MLWKIIRVLLTLGVLAILAGAVTFLFLGWNINRTGARDEAQRTDVIVILGARVEPDGRPGPDLWERTQHAIGLFQRGLAPNLVCTGGYQGDRLSAASVACSLAVSQGVPAEKVFLADGSSTTGEDAASTRELMAARGWQSANLVSHPLHLERARLLFEEQGITVHPSPTSTNLRAIPWKTRTWLTAREAVGILWIYLEDLGVPYEWTTLLSHWVYGLAEQPPAGP